LDTRKPRALERLSIYARAKVEQEFTIERQAQTYLKLYEDILVDRNATKFKQKLQTEYINQ
jgi:glycosyltransferase involved in cell wall biosynthesis